MNDIKARSGKIGSTLLISAMVFILGLSVSGCFKEKDAGERVTLRFVTWKPNQPEVWDEILRIFHQEHHEIKIEREIGPHSSTAFLDRIPRYAYTEAQK